MDRLQSLDISQNHLSEAPCLSWIKYSLEKLNLSWNKISHISNTYFDSCVKMTHLYLHDNQLIEIPYIRIISKAIRALVLDANYIASVMPIYGIQFPRLQFLSLNSNQIKSFCFPPEHFAPVLHEVFLALNNLSSIIFADTDASSRGDVLMHLGENPWHCDGSLGWTQKCVHGGSSRYMRCMGWLVADDMICASPPNVTGLRPGEAGKIPYGKVPRIDVRYPSDLFESDPYFNRLQSKGLYYLEHNTPRTCHRALIYVIT